MAATTYLLFPQQEGTADGVEEQVLILDTVSGYEYDKKIHIKFS